MLGNCSVLKTDSGRATIEAGEAPVYLVPMAKDEVEKLLKD
jgi:hypothetical protein